MAQEETILLHFDIDEQPAVNSIKDLRAANSQLRAERDKVNISTKEGRELVDKLNVSIDKNNKLIKDNSSALEKQRQNVGNYSKSIEEAAGNLNIMGTNVGQLGKTLGSFVNPATAAVGIITALGAAYARSAVGADDLARAQNNVKATLAELSNQIGNKSGGGLAEAFSLIVSDIAIAFTSNTKEIAKQRTANLENARFQLETLRLLEEQQITSAQTRKETEKAAEDARRIRDDQSKTEKDRLDAVKRVTQELNNNENARTGILNKQIETLLKYGEAVGSIEKGVVNQFLHEQGINFELIKDRDQRILIRKLAAEVADIQEEINGKLTENVKAEQAITNEYAKQSDSAKKLREETQRRIKQQAEEEARRRSNPDLQSFDIISNPDQPGNPIFDSVVEFRTAEEIKRDEANKTAIIQNNNAQIIADIEKQMYQERLAAASLYFNAASTLAQTAFGEGSELFKAISIGETIINTYSAATAALAPPPQGLGPVLGPALAAATIATGLANVARIQGVGFAEGGWTGPGSKYQPAGIVHANEYVTPSHIVNAPAAQPHLAALEGMRLKGYADGGFVTNTNMESTRQAQMLANTLKNQPPIVASWTEGRAVGRRVEFKEKVSRQ